MGTSINYVTIKFVSKTMKLNYLELGTIQKISKRAICKKMNDVLFDKKYVNI
jgi:hypothetical protein